jgi:hypothetical protein
VETSILTDVTVHQAVLQPLVLQEHQRVEYMVFIEPIRVVMPAVGVMTGIVTVQINVALILVHLRIQVLI